MGRRLEFMYCTLVTLILGVLSTEREGKGLSYRQHTDDLNIEHIINLWNRSVSETTSTTTTEQIVVETEKPIVVETEKPIPKKPPTGFIERFNYCVKRQKPQPDQAVKCLKNELVLNLHRLINQPGDTIKLFNGYLEFQKLNKPVKEDTSENEIEKELYQKPAKKYSSRVSSKRPLELRNESELHSFNGSSSTEPFVPVELKQPKISQSHENDYYESYQKMLKELVARKNGVNITREKRDGRTGRSTLEKSARLFENGRKLVKEISNNLENGEEDVETFTETILDPDLSTVINNFTKTYSLRLNFYPGVAARMKRNENSGVTFDLELDEINEPEETVVDDDGGREGKKKNKKKISKKTLKKLFPYLLIPFMIQAALLPIVLKFLLFVAIKALVAGKLALILVAFNAIRNASLKSEEDEYAERMSYEHYGYHPNNEEYGAWINRRNIEGVEGADRRNDQKQEDTEPEYIEPYAAYAPEDEPRKV